MRSAFLAMLALLCVGCEAKPEPKPAPIPVIVIVTPRPPFNPALVPKKVEVLDFYTTWCGPCKQSVPVVNKIERDGFKVTRIDCDQDTATADRYGVDRYPTFVVLRDGKEVYRTHNVYSLRSYLNGGSKFPRL